MSFDLNDFKPLAGILLQQGAPLLARALLGPLGGAIAGAVVPSIAEAFGLSADAAPAEIAAAAAKDDAAAEKLAAIQEEHADLLNWAKQTQDANASALAAEGTFLGRLFVGGWRPAIGWTGVFTLVYHDAAPIFGFKPMDSTDYATTIFLLFGLAGIRGGEKVFEVARTSFAKQPLVKAPLARKAR